jgi:curved DNA-binding protein CbpA
VYNKTRFYELAKLYHPDRKHHTKHDGVPHLTKLERYRLVVAANDILSDPVKRRLYDLYGAGWGGKGDMQSKYREVDRAWRSRPGNASMNATWEDWERWYQERDGVKQQPVFTSNGVFAGIVVLLVLIGGWGQTTRAGKHSVGLLEMRDQKHEGVSKELQHRISESSGKSRQDRVETFLRQREGWGYDSPSVPER